MRDNFMMGIDYYVRQLTYHQFICHNQPYIIIHDTKTMYSVRMVNGKQIFLTISTWEDSIIAV